jgi:hypothetical protein
MLWTPISRAMKDKNYDKIPLILDSNCSITWGILDTQYTEWMFLVKNELVLGVELCEERSVLNVREH